MPSIYTVSNSPSQSNSQFYSLTALPQPQVPLASKVPLFGRGMDQDLTVGNTFNVNTSRASAYANVIKSRNVDCPVASITATSGAALTVTYRAGLFSDWFSGDVALVINQQGDSSSSSNVGNFEMVMVSAVTPTTITLTSPLTNIYGPTNNSTLGNQKINIYRIAEYNSAVISNGATLTCSPWNGTWGGLLAAAAQTLTCVGTGKISLAGLGYRAGVVAGAAGEGTSGGFNTVGFAANGSGGGGGANSLTIAATTGGNGAAGAAGTNSIGGSGGGGGGGSSGGAGGGGGYGATGGAGSTYFGGGGGGSGLGGGGASSGGNGSSTFGTGATGTSFGTSTGFTISAGGSGGNGAALAAGTAGAGSSVGTDPLTVMFMGGAGGNSGAGSSGANGGSGGSNSAGSPGYGGAGGGNGGGGGGFTAGASPATNTSGGTGTTGPNAGGNGNAGINGPTAATAGGGGGSGGGIAFISAKTTLGLAVVCDGTAGTAGGNGGNGGIGGIIAGPTLAAQNLAPGGGGGGGAGGSGGGSGAGGACYLICQNIVALSRMSSASIVGGGTGSPGVGTAYAQTFTFPNIGGNGGNGANGGSGSAGRMKVFCQSYNDIFASWPAAGYDGPNAFPPANPGAYKQSL